MSQMPSPQLLASLTEKQSEALGYVSAGYTSKEAARVLEISHKSFDRRIEIAKNKLGAATRQEAVRIFRAQRDVELDHTGPTHIPPGHNSHAAETGRGAATTYTFADSMTFVEPAPWESFLTSVSEIQPSRFGPVSRLVLMLIAAVLIMAVLLLGLGIVEGLEALR